LDFHHQEVVVTDHLMKVVEKVETEQLSMELEEVAMAHFHQADQVETVEAVEF
jgi:hypothetical protein